MRSSGDCHWQVWLISAALTVELELALMTSTVTRNRLPRSAIFEGKSQIELVEQYTRRGLYSLRPSEVHWRDRQPTLDKHGYILRRRYAPYWKPSWLGTDMDPFYCEDSISCRVIVSLFATICFPTYDHIVVSRTTRLSTPGAVKTERSWPSRRARATLKNSRSRDMSRPSKTLATIASTCWTPSPTRYVLTLRLW